ncbi:ATPase family AAA domain-containing protein 5 [Echria macrotheca]|uniref:ATPase family AAA domain-containing protein 5 n=1 Tax=Echria macrotheca TaxID=438768 RepID=A0AAJ0B5Q3_9PEZI|nr:ATPase family AAA domain-containing protein 5 [Echria macrotheca]
MGSVAVLAMADDASGSEHANRKPLHPFFALARNGAPNRDKSEENGHAQSKSQSISSGPIDIDDENAESVAERATTRQNRRPKASNEDEDSAQKKRRAKKQSRSSTEAGIPNHFFKLKTVDAQQQGEDSESLPQADVELPPLTRTDQDGDYLEGNEEEGGRASPAVAEKVNSSHSRPQTPPKTSPNDSTKPKKMLRFNPKTGTFGSPPTQRQSRNQGNKGAASNSESVQDNARPSRIVVIKYGQSEGGHSDLRRRVNAILSGDERVAAPASRPSPPSKRKSVEPAPAAEGSTPKRQKTTHPFFLDKFKKTETSTAVAKEPTTKPDSPVQKRVKVFSSTPCSPKKPRINGSDLLPQIGAKNLGMKHPGARLPAWPWSGVAHVRNIEHTTGPEQALSHPFPSRKSKGQQVKVPTPESILDSVTKELDIRGKAEEVRHINNDDFLPPPSELRLPQKHFESGRKLQSRIIPELRTFRPPTATKKGVKKNRVPNDNQETLVAPPQLSRLFESVSTGLSAFDRSECETSNWTQKYAPISAVEVLQEGQELFLLRDWLQALMVQSVDTGATEPEKTKGKGKSAGAGNKKRRKKLDGFIVSSDDEDGLYAASDDGGEDWMPNGIRGIMRKTVVWSTDLSKGRYGGKIPNTVIISGPRGCGKTSAVYAVAKELDFEVFELNPGSRRSGKDILEKIGDMTQNHHVRQHQALATEDEMDTAIGDETANDIKSGKQSTMSAFFKPKSGTAKAKQQKAPKKESPNQRQSLILVEEADILYADDKQFWPTIISLIAQSRRPFVITCNDETVLPFSQLKLHGIFRLTSPPLDYAVDRLILIAANEGHAITRETAQALYESRGHDLRAATTDLQLWCQIGVGDRRGGFEWFYPRWPKGVDLDENGQVVRVVSQGTYITGMNWLGRDRVVDSDLPARLVEEELLGQCWDHCQVDVGHWEDTTGLSSWAGRLDISTASPVGRLKALEAFDGYADAMSSADGSGRKSFAVFPQEPIDTTPPIPSAKTQDDYPQGFSHVFTPQVTYFHGSPETFTSAIRSLAKASLRADTEDLSGEPSPELQPLDENKAIRCIQKTFSDPVPGTNVISRLDFSSAFDAIAVPDTPQVGSGSSLDPSVFDRTFKMIAVEVAPYVRGIVSYESELQKQRQKLSSLVSEGGRAARGTKRMRTTRASLSALEGGSRSTTRGQKWFKADLNPYLVMKTGGEGWAGQSSEEAHSPGTPKASTASSSVVSSPTSPNLVAKKGGRRGRPRKQVIEEDSADELGA